jgi:diguanylate cyclase (GGDEF)-like protein
MLTHIQSRFYFLLAGAAALTCAAALTIGVTIWWLHSEAIANASNNTGNLATVLAHQIDNSVQSIDLVLTDIADQEHLNSALTPNDIDHVFRGQETNQFLLERLSHLPQAELITLVDKNGEVVNTTEAWPSASIDLSDRAHFQHFKSHDDKGIYISDTLISRSRGTPIVAFSKRISDANNAFIGEVVVSVRLSYFQHIYESIASLPDQSFLLLRRDGTIIARYPDPENHILAKVPAGSPWYRVVSQGGGTLRTPGIFDGKTRLVGVRPLSKYPLVVDISVLEAAALATWRMQAITLGIGTLLVMFCVAFLLKAQSNQFNRLATSEAKLVERAHELKSANTELRSAQAQTNATLDNMSQGLVMLDSSARILVTNRRYLEMYGLSPEFVRPGCTLREVLEQRAATGSFCVDDIEQYMADVLAAVDQGTIFSRIMELHDGRLIRVVNQPLAHGGSVATHEDVTEEKRAEERIAYEACVDALTGLPNRKVFCEQLEQELKRVQRRERLAVLYLDIDYLKRVNDTLGHPAGDKLLKDVADRLRDCVRDIDVVARLSGDEFAIIQKLLDRPSDAAALAIRVREAILEPFDLNGRQVRVDASVGISIAPNDATERDELMQTADIALYEAKNSGRGTYCFYEPEMTARMQVEDRLEQDLKSALANGEFELFYQPIASLEDDKITSFEALLRWHHPTRGPVSPAEFIPLAEKTGLIIPLGEWILRTACAEAATWPDNIQIAVNVSSVQLTDNKLADVVVGAIAAAGIQPNRLELEITESALMQNTSGNLATLKSLHDLGVQIAMDDFGTGYSSLSYLLSFPFHRIKIDRFFIAALTDKTESHVIVRAIADLARTLKLRITAEGVETAQQFQQVRMLGCTEMQGYLLSPPRPAAEISRFFTTHAESADTLIAVDVSANRRNGKMCGIRPDLVCSHLLTGRECDVLIGIISGDTTKDTARHLNLSPRTVEVHRAHIKEKFEVKNSADLVRVMLTRGCLPSRGSSRERATQTL